MHDIGLPNEQYRSGENVDAVGVAEGVRERGFDVVLFREQFQDGFDGREHYLNLLGENVLSN